VTKYLLEGLDCAQCAAEIETALNKVERFKGARVSFATQSLLLPADAAVEAQRLIAEVEPDVVLKPTSPETESPRPDSLWGEGWRLGTAALLLVAGFILQAGSAGFRWFSAESLVFLAAYALVGYPVLFAAARNLVRGRVFDEMFLMSLATIGALVLQQLPEAGGVMVFYAAGEFLQDRAVHRSRRSITRLMDLRPETVRVVEDGTRLSAAPEEVAVGALVEILPGERVPLDGIVEQGESSVDTSSLTGESVPRLVAAADTVSAGYVNDGGRLLVRVTRPFGQSSAARILELVENAAAQKAPTEKFITRFARIYTPIVVLGAALLAVVPPLLFGGSFEEWLYRALVVLVISCPCALVLSIPLGYFGGLGGASRQGLLVKGATHLDALTQVDTVVFDKTGTLTKGAFAVTRVAAANGFDDTLLGLAAAAESLSSHPIARSIVAAYGGVPASPDTVSEVRGQGVIAVVGGRRVVAGSRRLLAGEKVSAADIDGTVVHVAVDGIYAGYLIVSDELKQEAAAAVEQLRAQGVRRIVVLTGDSASAAERMVAPLNVDDVYAGQLPEDKVNRLETLMASVPAGKKVVFVGDGMNDAPVLVRSDVGFAMGGLGSDAAVEAADVVVMDDALARVPQALRIAAFTRRVVLQNIAAALAVKAVFVAMGVVGLADMWEAVIADVGVSLLAVLNAMRTIRSAG
jgi:Cd2+/Zn2+-exporting ATPase